MPDLEQRRIYDTFLFDGELDLLEHRLRETFDLVDKFVLVEAGQTFRGQPKALNYSANAARFAWAAAKIIPISLHTLGGPSRTPWERQALQRNAVALGVREARPDDLVLVLDADEIVSRSLLERLRADGLERPHRLAMTRHYEFLDQLGPRSACCPPLNAIFAFEAGRLRPGDWSTLDAGWHGHSAVVLHARDILGADGAPPAYTAYDYRRGLRDMPVLHNAGRHLIAVDPNARLQGKLGRVSHAELGDDRAKNPYFLDAARNHGVHHHGWWYAETPTGPLPADLQRLAERVPTSKRHSPMPGMLQRRLLRSWAWLRYWPALPDKLVFAIDRRFKLLSPGLAPVLLIADVARALAARWGWRRMGALSIAPANLGHG